MAVTRRTFLKIAGAAGVAAGGSGLLFDSLFVRAQGPNGPEAEPATAAKDRIAFSGCYACLGRCTLQVQITGDDIPRFVTGDVVGTVNEGGVCALGASSPLHYLSPARVRYPMLRNPGAERGEGKFVRLTWDDMYDILVNGDEAAFLKDRGWKYGFLGMKTIREKFPEKFVFFTGRDQYNPTQNGFFASNFGSPNQGAHGSFCAVNVALGGTYTAGGTWWEYGGLDPDDSQLVIMAGVANDHFPTGTRRVITKIRSRGARFVLVNPDRLPNLGEQADEWVPINPGTDGAMVMSLMHELVRLNKAGGGQFIDEDYLQWYTNSPYLVITNPDGSIDPPSAGNIGLFARMKNSKGDWAPAVMGTDGQPHPFDEIPWQTGVAPNLNYQGQVTVPVAPDSTQTITLSVTTAFNLLVKRVSDPQWDPDNVSEVTGIPADQIRNLAQEIGDTAFRKAVWIPGQWTDTYGRNFDGFVGRPVTLYIMRGVSAHSNGFQSARDYMILLTLIGAVDAPGGWRYKPPAPWPIPDGAYWPAYGFQPDPRQRQKNGAVGATTFQELIRNDGQVVVSGLKSQTPAVLGTTKPLIYTPDQMVVDEQGKPLLIDRAYSWDVPLSLHRVWSAVNYDAGNQFPYRIEFLLWHITNPYWDNSYNLHKDLELVKAKHEDGRHVIPFVAIVDTFYGNSVPYVDLLIPDTTFFERFGVHSLLDRPISTVNGPADSIHWPILPPLYGVQGFGDTEIRLGEKLGIKAFLNPDGSPKFPKGYEDFIWKWEVAPGVGLLGGARGSGTSILKDKPNPDQIKAYTTPQSLPAYQGQGANQNYPGMPEVPVNNGSYPAGVAAGEQQVGHAHFQYNLPTELRYRRNVNAGYLKWAHSVGLIPYAKPVPIQIYSEIVQKFRLAGNGLWQGSNAYFLSQNQPDKAKAAAQPPTDERGQALRKIYQKLYDPLPSWYEPLEWAADGADPKEYPLRTEHRHVNPWFYHHWENHNPWHRPLMPFSPIYMNKQTADKYGIGTGDWVEFEARSGEQVRGMVEVSEATRPGVVWYWKARNVRSGTLAISPNSPEVKKGIMFNDIYSYRRPESWGGGEPGSGLLNFDPFTGMTAWGDLRLKVVRKSDIQESSYGKADPMVREADHSFMPDADQMESLNFSAYDGPAKAGMDWYKKTEG